jgi:hypothetical protein
MPPTSAVDALTVVFAALPPDEQEEALDRLHELRLDAQAPDESQTGRMIRSIRRVAEVLDYPPSVDEYKTVSRELIESGEDIETFSRLYSHFRSWPRAHEALLLSETNSTKLIDARFRKRRVGKVWRYTEQALGDTLAACVDYYRRPPLVSEFEWWRDHQLELAAAQGNDNLHLPSPTPYRKRWGTWEKALLHFGYTPEQTAQRHQRT